MALPVRLLAIAACAASAAAQFTLHLLNNTAETGAVCLDGSPAGYYFRQGDPTAWTVSLQGGGWCWDLGSCLERAGTALGSSKFWAPTGKFGGLLDVSPSDNPMGWNRTMVLLPYGDGASFSGDVAEPVSVNGTLLYFRGHRILKAVLDALIPLGLGEADDIIVMGGSAGGLSTYLHVDFMLEFIKENGGGKTPSKTAAFPDCGFFLATAPDVFGRPFALEEYQNVVLMQNVTGSPEQVDADCWAATPPDNRWQCFTAPFTYPHVTTPLFLTNSQYDTWQLGNIWAPPGDGADGSYGACISHPLTSCNASQYASLQSYHVLFQTMLNMSVAAAGPRAYTTNGGFVTSCLEHGQQEEGLWDVISIGGTSMRQAMMDWFTGSKGPNTGQYWTLDGPYPGNPTCPGGAGGALKGLQ